MSTYGATGNNSNTHTNNNNHNNQQNDTTEQDRLINHNNNNNQFNKPSPYLLSNLTHHLTHTKITPQNTEYILLSCYLITGILDSSATAIWGCFVSMQTGNSIYLGLGLANPDSYGSYESGKKHIKALISILSFCTGSFLFSRFHRKFGSRRRWVLITSFVVQVLMISVAAIIVMLTPDTKPGNGHDLDWHVLVPLAMVAFQSSGQAVVSRAVDRGMLTSVVLTTIYCDLFADTNLFVGITKNKKRNWRATAPVLLLAGAVLGGFFSRKGQWGIAGALWVAAALKTLIVVAWCFWRTEDNDDEEGEGTG